MATLMQANREWANRPAEERYTSLTALDAFMADTRSKSKGLVGDLRALQAVPVANEGEPDGLALVGQAGVPAAISHYAFGQLAATIGTGGRLCPASYLTSLPAELAARNINHGLSLMGDEEKRQLLMRKDDEALSIRAINSPTYGRIWNNQLTSMLVSRFGDGVTGDWRVPGEFGKAIKVTKSNTTLYGSDKDMFVFLADETNRIEVKDRRDGQSGSLARGFFVWNSEVGDATLGIATFLFDYACSNRIVWGAQEFKELKLRHSSNAPERFLDEVMPMLTEYQHAQASKVENVLQLAQAAKVDDFDRIFKKLDIVPRTAKQVMATHITEENRPMESMWDLSTGITAFAKSIPYQSERVAFERKSGLVLDLVANAA